MAETRALLEDALAKPDDRQRWLVYADALTEADDPLGEIISISFVDGKSNEMWRRLWELRRAWAAKHLPWAELLDWSPAGLQLRATNPSDFLDHVAALRALGFPLLLDVPNGDVSCRSPCVFDARFERFAWLKGWRENHGTGSWGPSFEDDWHYFWELRVCRVADRRELHHDARLEGQWRDFALKDDGLWAIDLWDNPVHAWRG